jgi:hypothetical protein
MNRFDLLSDTLEDGQTDLWDLLEEKDLDVDRWEIAIPPDEYFARFKDTLAAINLVNWIPKRMMETTYHRGPGFDKWLLLAEATHQIWIHPPWH